jgi:hypothetical protein
MCDVVTKEHLDKLSTMNQKMTDLIHRSSDKITCPPGSECMIQRTTNQLKQEYEKAKIELDITAPEQFKEAQKKYIIYTEGEQAYQNLEYRLAQELVDDKVLQFIENYQMLFEVAYYKNQILQTKVDSYKYIFNVLLQTIANNGQIENELEITDNKILTNDRKTFYEQENYTSLKWWFKFWMYIYIFLLVIFIIAIFLGNSDFTFLQKLGILSIFIIYIPISEPVTFGIIYLIYYIKTLLPKNVYFSLYS